MMTPPGMPSARHDGGSHLDSTTRNGSSGADAYAASRIPQSYDTRGPDIEDAARQRGEESCSTQPRVTPNVSLADGLRQLRGEKEKLSDEKEKLSDRWKNGAQAGAFGYTATSKQAKATSSADMRENGLSVILDRRVEDVNERFNQYTEVLRKLKDANPNDDAHQHALRDIIARRANFYKEYSLPSSHRSNGTLSDSKRQVQDWIPKPTEIVPILQLPSKDSELRNISEYVRDDVIREREPKRDEVIRELRWRLRKKEEELGNSSTMLSNTQQALEHLFHENIEMAEELMTVFKDTTSFLDELEEENRGLKEELRNRTEKANSALLEIAQRNCELTSKLEAAQKEQIAQRNCDSMKSKLDAAQQKDRQIFTVTKGEWKDPERNTNNSLQARLERTRRSVSGLSRSTSTPPHQLSENRVERVPRRNENTTGCNNGGLRSRYASVSADLKRMQRKALIAAS